jgi:hypothetical protein
MPPTSTTPLSIQKHVKKRSRVLRVTRSALGSKEGSTHHLFVNRSCTIVDMRESKEHQNRVANGRCLIGSPMVTRTYFKLFVEDPKRSSRDSLVCTLIPLILSSLARYSSLPRLRRTSVRKLTTCVEGPHCTVKAKI